MGYGSGHRALHLSALSFSVAVLLIVPAFADGSSEPVPPALLGELAGHVDRMMEIEKNASVKVTSRLEKLDRHGKVDGYAERVIQVVQANGHKDQQLVRFVEDGEDKTASARKEFAEERAKPKGKRIEFEFPFRASEQPKYRFSVVGKDPNNPANVRIRYAPVGPPSEKEYLGEAWVDQSKGTLISMGFRPTKFPSFVDRADVQLEVQAATPMGPTVSRVFAQGEGGFLFIRKHFRFTLSFSDYALNPP